MQAAPAASKHQSVRPDPRSPAGRHHRHLGVHHPRLDVGLLVLHPVHQADAAAEDHQPGPQGPRRASGTRRTCARRRPSSKRKSAYRAIVDDALLAQDQHGKLTDPIDQHDWMANSLARSQGAIGARLGEGLAFLATVGSTAPFIGLFGTVVGIYRALIKIGASGQASIDDGRRPGR